MKTLTDRQAIVLDFITAHIDQHGVAPSYREIAEHLGISSTNGVSDHLLALERKGYIERYGSGKARSVRLTSKARTHLTDDRVVGVPVLGRIAAGMPIAAVEDHDLTLMVDSGLLPSGGDVFALIVRGESMIDEGILDGDYVFVKSGPAWRDSDLVAALVDGEATVKRIYRERGAIRLQPSNADMAPIYVRPDVSEFEVLGQIVGLHRRY